MPEHNATPKYINIGLALYGLIFTLIAIDIAEDYGDGMDWGHVSIELLVLIMAVMGITLLGRAYYQNTQLAIQHLQSNLANAQLEASRWRDESRDLILGLGVEIQKQFVRWGLIQAGLTGRASLSAFFLEDLLLPNTAAMQTDLSAISTER